MVTCSSSVADAERWKEPGHARAEELQSSATKPSSSPSDSSPSSACRALVYDVETGSLRYSQPSGRAASVTSSCLSPRSPRSPPSRFKVVPSAESSEQLKLGEAAAAAVAVESPQTPPFVHGKPHCGAFTESGIHEGETSLTRVIQNSAARSNASSPTRVILSSAASKAPVDVPGGDEIGDARERIKKLESVGTTASGIPGLEGSPPRQTQFNSDSVTITKENNNWSYPQIIPHEDLNHAEILQQNSAHDHTMPDSPFKSMAKAKKSKYHGAGRVPALSGSGHTASIMHCKSPGGVFSFNAAYMPLRSGHRDTVIDSELFSETRGDTSILPTITQGRATNINAAATATHMQQQQQQQQQLGLSRRTYSLAPLLMLKPTPSKWDDAEKWLPGSECPSATTRAKTSRSGPLLTQMVAAQAGMSIPWRGAITAPIGSQAERHVHHHLSSSAGVAPEQRVSEPAEVRDSTGLESVEEHVKDVHTPSPTVSPSTPLALVDFAAAYYEKQRLNLLQLRDRNAVENSGDLGPSREGSTEFAALSGDDDDDDGDDDDDDDGGSASPSRLNGSFLKLGVRMEKPQVVVEFSPSSEDCDSRATLADLGFNSKPSADMNTRNLQGVSETRDMGTAMTPIASVDPSLTSTPLRATTTRAESKISVQRSGDGSDHDAETKSAGFVMSEKEMQERKTRQEIVALGTQLGKASIAAAWAAREKEQEGSEKARESFGGVGERNEDIRSTIESDLEKSFSIQSQRDVFASRAEVWQEAEKAKYTTRFEQDQVKIQAWEEHEKAKAEAEMRKAEVKAERLKSQAHEKRAYRVAAARRRAEELGAAAEARRADAAAKAARKAEILKTNGRTTNNLLFLSLLCT